MKTTVLITGVGAVIGQGIIKSLRLADVPCRLVGIDANPFSVGFQWTDASYTVVRNDDPSWVDSIIRICNDENISIILPGIEQDVKAFLKDRGELNKSVKAYIMLNSPEALAVGFDKWKLNQLGRKLNLKMPPTWLTSSTNISPLSEISYPCLLKPRHGMAGKGIYKVENRKELERHLECIDGSRYILQKYIGDENDEYTASIFGFGNNVFSEPFAMRRKLCYGTTFEAETVFDQPLSEKVSLIAKALKVIGPTNIQFRKVDGDYILLEVNPRFSSSTSIKSAFGFNEPLMAVKTFAFGEPPTPCVFKRGRCSRYIIDDMTFL